MKKTIYTLGTFVMFMLLIGSNGPIGAANQTRSIGVLNFSNQTNTAGVSLLHSTPITSGDGAQMISGGATGDFNKDGWADLYVIGGGDGETDGLFINQKDGTFANQTAAAGLDALHLGSGAAVGDYNNDGWLDIYVTSFGTIGNMAPGKHLLYHNNGDGTFTDVAAAAGVNKTADIVDGLGAAFGDYDLDGDLDLFVAGWRKPGGVPSLGNRLFVNNGNGTFTDVTGTAGIVDNGVRGFSPCFLDMDGDQYPELLLAADFGTTQYYKNDTDGTFTEYTEESGTQYAWSGMGSTVGDFNNDGRFDWFETAIYDDSGDGRGDGNKLYINQGNHKYAEIANTAGVADGGWGWGSAAVDLNHDGWQDLAEVNGWDFGDVPSESNPYKNERGKIWLNNGDLTFTEVAESVNFDHMIHGMGLFNLDYDNDGDQDIATTAYNDNFNLFRNDLSGSDTSWLRIFLDNNGRTDIAPNGFGANVTVTVDGVSQYRSINGCSHYLSQSELSAHFGLGGATIVDELRVDWPNGDVSIMTNVAVNQTLTITPKFSLYLPLITQN
jgi:hypothetical protein